MDLGIKDRTALVTAGSRGFGLATALRLAAEVRAYESEVHASYAAADFSVASMRRRDA